MSAPANPLAFPSIETHPSYDLPVHHFGMNLRDWFAGQALAGLMANANIPFAPDYAECEPEQIAGAAFNIADAMLTKREQGGTA